MNVAEQNAIDAARYRFIRDRAFRLLFFVESQEYVVSFTTAGYSGGVFDSNIDQLMALTEQSARKRALSRLTPEERELLGLK